VDEKFDEGTESAKKKSITIEMNEIAYTKLILSTVQLKMTLIYLRRTLIRSCMQNTRRNFWKIVEFTVPVGRYRIGRV
jgi:hypothetical protein